MTINKVLLGGIGKDSHSVGLNLLRLSLRERGFEVDYLGIQNEPAIFKAHANQYQLIMMSTLDGHASLYLDDFTLSDSDKANSIWILGGNLTIDADPSGVEAYFKRKGFDLVYPKYIDLRTIFEDISHVSHTSSRATGATREKALAKRTRVSCHAQSCIDDLETLSEDTFHAQRDIVLDSHPNGKHAKSLADNGQFLSLQPSFSEVVSRYSAEKNGIVIQPRVGVSSAEEQTTYLSALESAGIKVLSYQIDSLTRNNDYEGAEIGLRKNKLNGFPLINHGVKALREITEKLSAPLQVRHSTRDPRLLAEISFAGGVTSYEGGPICYNIPYYKDCPLSESLNRWNYVDRLCGYYYQSHGIVIDREFFGTLTGTLIPPSLAIVCNLLEMLVSVELGVKSVSLGYAEQGNRAQDIAAIRVMKSSAEDLLEDLGYTDVCVHTVFHQYMAAFPAARERSEQLIYASAQTAALSGANRLLYKTVAEFSNIPSLEDNLTAYQLVKSGIKSCSVNNPDSDNIAWEVAIITREVSELLSAILSASENVAECIVHAFNRGWLDIPFSPSLYSQGQVLTARDNHYAVRYLNTGKLPLSEQSKRDNREKIEAKKKEHRIISDSALLEHDLLMVPRHDYPEWPLSP